MAISYIIITTPRTGSFLLCEGLEATGIAGHPQEYAPAEDSKTWRDFHGCSCHAEYFYRFPSFCLTPNGTFGAKLMWLQYLAWKEDARRYLSSKLQGLDLIESVVGSVRLVRLIRQDIVRQAISWIRAQGTGIWSERHNEAICHRDRQTPTYDSVLLRQTIEKLKIQNRNWEYFLSTNDSPLLNITYEELSMNYETTVGRVLRFLELDYSVRLPKPILKQQADHITEEWVARARLDLEGVA